MNYGRGRRPSKTLHPEDMVMHDQLPKFQSCIGERYTIEHPQRAFAVTLKEATPLTTSTKDSYSLLLESVEADICPQGVYRLKGAEFDCPLLVVPVGQTDQGVLYEIIVN